MKSNTYLKNESVLTLLALNNLIVPEIQREYVWGDNENVLKKFIEDVKKHAEKCDSCKRVHSRKINNIGFLYSYKPPYSEIEKGRYLDEFLIDGQQRITTIFLLLLARAVKENRIKDFISVCRIQEDGYSECFNYKVRSLTQDFLNCLLRHIIEKKGKSLDFIMSQDRPSWFLLDFEQDPTVSAMCKSLEIIIKSFENDEYLYFDFLLENIHFWHFKTEATSQGEELYISMNSTGEQLSNNEIKKAEILSKENSIELGSKWESWQNIFWRNRHKGLEPGQKTGKENADRGFNNYLLCIEDLEKKTGDIPPISDTYQIYIDALSFITNSCCDENDVLVEKLKELRLPEDWLKEYRNKIWNLMNTQNWSIGEKITDAANRITMLFWPWMYYFKLLKQKDSESDLKNILSNHLEDLLRILHLFYIRYYCEKRDYRKIKAVIDIVINEGGYDNALNKIQEASTEEEDTESDPNPFYEEEKILQNLYNNDRSLESIIWNIQNIPVIKDGSYCGGNTILKFTEKLKDCESAKQVLRFLGDLFDPGNQEPQKDIDKTLLKTLLLYYSNSDEDAFWQVRSNGKFFAKEWKRMVRSNAFWRFYDDYNKQQNEDVEHRLSNEDIKNLLSGKKQRFFDNIIFDYNRPLPFRYQKAIIYDAICPSGTSIWDNGNIGFDIDSSGSHNTMFNDKDELYRINEYMRSNQRLELPDNWQDVLRENYNGIEFINYGNDIAADLKFSKKTCIPLL